MGSSYGLFLRDRRSFGEAQALINPIIIQTSIATLRAKGSIPIGEVETFE